MKHIESWENLTISNDFMFCKVMRDKEICKQTLEILLNCKIGNIEFINDQETINIAYDSKSIRLDVYVEDENKIYNIEMQVVNNGDLAKRSRYYQSMIDLNAIEKGKIYKDLKDSIVIFICRFDPFKCGDAEYIFENTCIKRDLKLNDGTKKIFFNTKAYSNAESKGLKSLLSYIEGNAIRNDEFIKRIHDRIESIKRNNREWRAEYIICLY